MSSLSLDHASKLRILSSLALVLLHSSATEQFGFFFIKGQFGPATMERRVIQEFIEIYRSEPSLWKVRSSHYNNKAIKNVAYRRMVNKLREIYPNADVEMVKRKINALRTNYRKELRKVEASKERNQLTGEPVYVPSLWYFELFHFIADQESEPPIIDVTDGVEVRDMLRVDFDENMAFEREELSDEFDDEVSKNVFFSLNYSSYKLKLSGATAHEGQGLLCPSQYTVQFLCDSELSLIYGHEYNSIE
ncbi:UNVERIFIED_CONTAM: hypothetical protein NCL1_12409 [Trichonephila clavipes]